MTVHVLHAGDGYTYLTRQVAAGDHTLQRGQDLADYYTAEGNPPGRWLGEGLAELGMSGQVDEAQMKALFGEGRHPAADAIIQAAAARIAANRSLSGQQRRAALDAVVAGTRLGRAFPVFTDTSRAWRDRCEAAYARRARATGRPAGGLEEWERRRVALAEGLRAFREAHCRRPVDAAELRAFLAEQGRPARQPVAGYDLVFTPVKSVSVLWALGGDEVRQAVEAAHEAAWRQALNYVGEHAALTRTGAAGVAQIDTRGLVVAAFDHRDSRCGDPNLHTHTAVSTKVRGVDGKWRSLDGRVLHQLGVSASEVYNTRVEDELRARLGVRFGDRSAGRDARPVREVEGMPGGLLEAFSGRRSSVEESYRAKLADYRSRYGHEAPKAVQYRLAQQATLDTREGKAPLTSLAEQRASWRETAEEVLGAGAVDQVVAGALAAADTAQPVVRTGDVDVERAARDAVATVAENRATWNRWHVKAEVERALRSVVVGSPAERQDLADAVLARALSGHSIRIAAPQAAATPAALQRADGESVYTVHGAQRFTNQAILDAEDRLLAAARTPVAVGVSGETFARVAAAAGADGAGLDAGQVALARAFACNGRLLSAGIGPAGAGKTTAMRLAARAVEAGGGRVLALAPSARAAQHLGEEIGVEAATVHHVLAKLAHGGPARTGVAAGDVLLVDEAGMAGTLNLDRLVAHAADRGAVVRLLGDPMQLAAVESGGALRLIESEVGAARLHELYRFADPTEAATTLALREGDPVALDFYEQRGRVAGGTRDAMLDAVYDAWRADTAGGARSVMIASRRADVVDLATRARLDRVTAGHVELDGVRLHNGTTAGRGDQVVTRNNSSTLRVLGARDRVKNGDAWTVLGRHADGSLDVEGLTHRGRITLPAAYVQEHVELAYAATVHRVQGSTADTTHALVDAATTRESLYVAATRGRYGNRLYVVTDAVLDPEIDHAPDVARTPREVLEQALARDGVERSATETVRDALAAAESLATLVPEYEHARGLLTGDADVTGRYAGVVRAVLGAGAGEVLEDPAWPALADALVRADGAGLDPQRTLATSLAARGLDGAESVAQVLHHRVHRYLDARRQTAGGGAGLPEWIAHPPRRPAAGDAHGAELHGWVIARAGQIGRRVDELAGRAAVEQPRWAASLGPCPQGVDRWRWLAAAGRVAAYREQYGVATDDPGLPLGPRPVRAGTQARAFGAADNWHRRGVAAAAPTGTASTSAGETAAERAAAARRAAEGRTRQREAGPSRDGQRHDHQGPRRSPEGPALT